jgi:hypothetical protein
MIEQQLWCVYTPLLEGWVRETGAKILTLVNNADVTVEYLATDDPRVSLYGWNNFPLFAAVKYGNPYQRKIGKLDWDTYENWLRGLNWLI